MFELYFSFQDAIVPDLKVEALVEKIKGGIKQWKEKEAGERLQLKFMDVRQGEEFSQFGRATADAGPQSVQATYSISVY